MKSDSYNFIFIDIPKTGGSSINKALIPYANSLSRHKPIINYIAESRDNIDKYFKFAFVRNPWGWAVSWYFYRKSQYNENNISFKKWLMSENSSAYNNIGIGLAFSQSFFVLDHNNNIAVDFIGKFENIQNDFNNICSRLKLPICHLTTSNQTKHKPYWEYYDDESKDFINTKFKNDIDLFAYKFVT